MIEVLAEQSVSGSSFPWFEIPGWRERFGVIAGVTGRGSEAADYDLGLGGAGPVGEVLDRWRQVAAGFPGMTGAVVGRQVHGTEVRWHDRAAGWSVFEGVDGHATTTPGLLLAVSAADCIPVYLIDPVRRAVALLHAGWRGTAGGVLAAGIRLLTARAGSAPADLVMHCGVGICGACYQVGPEVASACGAPNSGAGGMNLDLRSVLAGQAAAQGLGQISVSSRCSAHEPEAFLSHRASGGRAGRMVALLGLIPP